MLTRRRCLPRPTGLRGENKSKTKQTTSVTTDTNSRSVCARTDTFVNLFPSLGGSLSRNPQPGSPARRCTHLAGQHACDPSQTPPVLSRLPRLYPARTTSRVNMKPIWLPSIRHLYLQETPSEDCEAQLVQVLCKGVSKTAVTTCNKHGFALHLESKLNAVATPGSIMFQKQTYKALR